MLENPAFVAAVAGLWLLIGLSLSLVMGRRGHNWFGWLVVGTLFGPLALVLAFSASRHDETLAPVAVQGVRNLPSLGAVDVLAGYDGSPESLHAIEAATRLLGDRLGRLTVATAVPYDNVLEAERHAQAELQRLSRAAVPAPSA